MNTQPAAAAFTPAGDVAICGEWRYVTEDRRPFGVVLPVSAMRRGDPRSGLEARAFGRRRAGG